MYSLTNNILKTLGSLEKSEFLNYYNRINDCIKINLPFNHTNY